MPSALFKSRAACSSERTVSNSCGCWRATVCDCMSVRRDCNVSIYLAPGTTLHRNNSKRSVLSVMEHGKCHDVCMQVTATMSSYYNELLSRPPRAPRGNNSKQHLFTYSHFTCRSRIAGRSAAREQQYEALL
eukprot:765731-Hanusia_phi.AAC.4